MGKYAGLHFFAIREKMISADNDRMVMILMKWTGYTNIVHQNYKKHEYAVYCLANDLYAKGGDEGHIACTSISCS